MIIIWRKLMAQEGGAPSCYAHIYCQGKKVCQNTKQLLQFWLSKIANRSCFSCKFQADVCFSYLAYVCQISKQHWISVKNATGYGFGFSGKSKEQVTVQEKYWPASSWEVAPGKFMNINSADSQWGEQSQKRSHIFSPMELANRFSVFCTL